MGRSACASCRPGPAPSSRGGRPWSHGRRAVPTAGPEPHRQDAPVPAAARASSRVRGGGAPEGGSCATHSLLCFGRQAGQCGLRTPYTSVPAPPDRGWCRHCSWEGMCGLLSLHDERCIMRERDDSDQGQRGAVPPRGHSHGEPLVGGVSAAHASGRRTHGGTWAPSPKGILPGRVRSPLRCRDVGTVPACWRPALGRAAGVHRS